MALQFSDALPICEVMSDPQTCTFAWHNTLKADPVRFGGAVVTRFTSHNLEDMADEVEIGPCTLCERSLR